MDQRPGGPGSAGHQRVDVILVATYAESGALAERLRARGLGADPDVICRHRHRPSGLILDVMPTESEAPKRNLVKRGSPIRTP